MRRRSTFLVAGILAAVGLWVTAVQTQVVQCGGSFVPSLNCTITGRWNFTNVTAGTGSLTQGPIPFQAGGTDVTGIVSRTTDLTNAQMLALNTTPVTVVPAPGAGYWVDVIGVSVIFNYTTAYSGASDLRLFYTNRGTGPAASATITASGLIVSVSADTQVRVTGTPDNTPTPTTNVPVVIQATSVPFTGGNAADSVRVVVNYRIVRTGL